MPRVKGGMTTRRRRKKIMKLAKGYVGSKRLLYRTAHEQVMRALQNAYKDRRRKKRDFRKLWITRINAAAKANGTKYSILVHGLTLAGVEVNRKVLADIAIHHPEDFAKYVEIALNAIKNPAVKPAKKVEVKKETVKEEPVKKEVSKTKKPIKEKVPYEKLLVGVLREEAVGRGIEGASKLLKAQLVEALYADDQKNNKK